MTIIRFFSNICVSKLRNRFILIDPTNSALRIRTYIAKSSDIEIDKINVRRTKFHYMLIRFIGLLLNGSRLPSESMLYFVLLQVVLYCRLGLRLLLIFDINVVLSLCSIVILNCSSEYCIVWLYGSSLPLVPLSYCTRALGLMALAYPRDQYCTFALL